MGNELCDQFLIPQAVVVPIAGDTVPVSDMQEIQTDVNKFDATNGCFVMDINLFCSCDDEQSSVHASGCIT